MSTIDSTRLMMQLRSMAAEASQRPAVGGIAGADGKSVTGTPDFAGMLRDSLNQVNGMQQTATELGNQFEQGVPGVDITRVMVEAQKATLAFRAMTEVRNRLVSAYQEVMNMTI